MGEERVSDEGGQTDIQDGQIWPYKCKRDKLSTDILFLCRKHSRTHASMYACMYISVGVGGRMHTCMCMRICACLHVCACVYIHIQYTYVSSHSAVTETRKSCLMGHTRKTASLKKNKNWPLQ